METPSGSPMAANGSKTNVAVMPSLLAAAVSEVRRNSLESTINGPSASVNSFEGDATRLASPTRASAVVATESPVGVAVIVQAREATELASTALPGDRVQDTSPTVIASAAVAGQ